MTKSEFVVTEHHAKKAGLHWDMRFRIPKSKMWASFAVRKGVPLKPKTKVLAVRTRDHDRADALLTGELKDGYGAGKFIEWDRGKCIIHKYSTRHISIEFQGKKVKGLYHFINIGVVDKNFKGNQFWLFKGKVVSESSGMASRVPTGGIKVDTEEGQSEEKGKKLPWSKCNPKSLSEGTKVMKNYAIVVQYTQMKGFFRKKPSGDYIIVGVKDSNIGSLMLFQFFEEIKPNMYLVGIVGGIHSPDDEVLEETLDGIRLSNDIKILEDKLPVKMKFGNVATIQFTKPSKYLGKKIELYKDSRLPEGYYMAKCTLKKGFDPAQQYKLGSGAMKSSLATKMRAFTTSRLKSIMKRKK